MSCEVLASAGSRFAWSMLRARRKWPPYTGVWAVVGWISANAVRATIAAAARRWDILVLIAHLHELWYLCFLRLRRRGALHDRHRRGGCESLHAETCRLIPSPSRSRASLPSRGILLPACSRLIEGGSSVSGRVARPEVFTFRPACSRPG